MSNQKATRGRRVEQSEAPKVRIAEGENKVLYEQGPDQKNELFRVTINRFKGKLYLGMAKWWHNGSDWCPGKGLRMAFDPEAVEMIDEGLSELKKALETVDFR